MFSQIKKVISTSLFTIWLGVQILLLPIKTINCKGEQRKVKSFVKYRVKKVSNNEKYKNDQSSFVKFVRNRHLQSFLKYRNKKVGHFRMNHDKNLKCEKKFEILINSGILKTISTYKETIQSFDNCVKKPYKHQFCTSQEIKSDFIMKFQQPLNFEPTWSPSKVKTPQLLFFHNKFLELNKKRVLILCLKVLELNKTKMAINFMFVRSMKACFFLFVCVLSECLLNVFTCPCTFLGVCVCVCVCAFSATVYICVFLYND